MILLLNLFSSRQERSGCSPVFLIGGAIVAFIAATTILWTNEGRVDFGRIGTESVPIETTAIDPGNDNAFVAATGTLTGDTPVGDDTFLRPGDWLEVERLVEMYAWVQKSEGGDEDSSTYSYSTAWTDDPADSSGFSLPEGHTNPPQTVSGGSFRPETGQLGAYRVDLRSLDLPDATPIVLTRETVIGSNQGSLSGEYVFVGAGTLADPQVGDLRIRFQAVESGQQATLFGQTEGATIGPYFHKERDRLYRAFFSTRADALAEMSAEYRFALWGMRVAGLLAYWASFMMIFSPFTRLLGGVPLLGRLGKGLIAAVTFVVAALLAVVVATIAYVAHNPLVLVILLVVAGALFVGARSYWQRRQETAGV